MMEIKPQFDAKFQRRIKQHFESFDATVGISPEDASKLHRPAKPKSRTSVSGMRARRMGKMSGSTSIGQVARGLLSKVDFIAGPFSKNRSNNMIRVRNAIRRLINAKGSSSSRANLSEALLRVVRDPIKRRLYDSNSRKTILNKGFNRKLFDTGQVWNAIKAKVTFKRRS